MKSHTFGIDVGGTNTVMGVVDRTGKVVGTRKIKTQAYPVFEDYIATIAEQLKLLAADTCGIENIKGIGIGAPNGNYYTGNIEFAPNLPWGSNVLPLSSSLSKATGLPVHVTNDANAAAMGEMVYGVARGMKNFIMITIGTGVGSGIVIDGKLLYGHDGFAGELGHVIVDRSESARPCGCGRKGCLETYCSATGIVRTAKMMLAATNEPSKLREIPFEQLECLHVHKSAEAGDALAIKVFEYTGEKLGQAIADFVAFSAPEAVVLFGGPTAAGDILLNPVRKSMEENMLRIWKGKVKLMISNIDGGDAAVLGASAISWE